MLYYFRNMQVLKILTIRGKKEKKGLDIFQASIDKVGKAQIQKIVDRGLKFPVFML